MNGIFLIKLPDGTELIRLTGTRFTTPAQGLLNVYRVFEGSEKKGGQNEPGHRVGFIEYL